MAEDPLTGDQPVRGGVEAEEQEAQAFGASCVEASAVTFRDGAGTAPVETPLLIVAEGVAAAMLADACLPDKQAIGSVDLPAIPAAEGALRRAELDAHSATIYRLQPAAGSETGGSAAAADPLLVICERLVLPERSLAWVRGLAAAVRPAHTVVISAMPAQQYRGGGDAAHEVLLFSVGTSAAAAGHGVPPLPSGNLVSGLAAAVLSHSQVRQVPAVSLVGVQMAPVPDATYLQRLATAARKVLASASPAGGETATLWRADKQAIRSAGIRAERAYRASSESLLYT